MLVGLLSVALHPAIVARLSLVNIARRRGFVWCFFETFVPLILNMIRVCIAGGSAGGSAPLRRDLGGGMWCGRRTLSDADSDADADALSSQSREEKYFNFLQFGAFLSYDDFFVVVQWICISIVFVCPSSIIQFGIFVIPLPLLQ